MKKTILSIILAICLLILSACGTAQPEDVAVEDQEITTTETDSPWEQISEDEWDELVIEQSNRHGLNVFCYDSSWLYGPWAGEDGDGELAKMRYDGSDWTVIDGNTNGKLASFQAVKNGFLYYTQATDDVEKLVKIRSSGDDAKSIVKEVSGSVQIVEDYIYFTTKETWIEEDNAATEDSCHLYRCNLEGQNVEAVIEKPVYYFSVIGDFVLYQDDKDNMSLHLFKLSSKEDIKLNEVRTFWPIFDGKDVFFISDTEDPGSYNHKLWKMSIDGGEIENIDVGCNVSGLLLRGEYIYYINADDDYRIYRCLKNGSDIELVTQDSYIEAMQWVGDKLAYACVDKEEGYYTGLYICDLDGGDKMEFCNPEWW